MIRKIDLRYMDYLSLPLDLIQSIAQLINRNLKELAEYLSLKPTVPSATRFKSSNQPKAPEQTDFFDEVQEDKLLNQEQREYWLAYKENK